MKLPLKYYGDPVLRKKCKDVGEVTDEIKSFAQDLIDTMEASNGAAIAAPQVGKDIRMFVICYIDNDKEGMPVMGEPKVYIDPVIKVLGDETFVYDEGCLSIPNLYAEVERPMKIQVEATNLKGERFTQVCERWVAKTICHENDHLNGVLFLDRLSKKERKYLEPSLRRIKKKYARFK